MRKLGWAALNASQWTFIACWTVLLVLLAIPLSLAFGRRVGLWMARHVWASAVALVTGARIEPLGTEKLRSGGPWLLACNHRSFADIPALFAALPVDVRFVAKRELRRVPFLGWYMAAMGMVFVDRERRSSGAASIEQVAALLRGGATVLSFPAGTRRAPGEVQGFKPAALAPALQAGVPVVPVAIAGSTTVLGTRRLALRPGTIRIRVGDPISTAGLSAADRAEVARRAEEAVERLLAELEAAPATEDAAVEAAAPLREVSGTFPSPAAQPPV